MSQSKSMPEADPVQEDGDGTPGEDDGRGPEETAVLDERHPDAPVDFEQFVAELETVTREPVGSFPP